MNKKYETDRLYLKVLKSNSAKKVLNYYKRNVNFLKEWDPRREDYFYTLGYQKYLLRYEYKEFKDNNIIRFWIVKKETSNIIGNICFSNVIMGNFKSCYLSYKLDKDETGKGYITEALKKGIDIMFNQYGLHRIEANIIPRNVNSLRVMERLKFEKEGYSKRYLMIDGTWQDHVHFAKYNDNN